ncbi:MAG: hypothetical protein ABFC62_08275 [Clostridiaceae bacterium]|nr:hypothetical protein [Eubacteriales bacterium]
MRVHRKEKNHTWVKTAGTIVLGLGAVVLMGFLLGFLIQNLWNWLMPELFSVSRITYWQGIGLFFLARFLIGGFGTEGKNKAPDKRGRHASSKAPDEADADCRGWMRYDEWWESEGEKAFYAYVEHKASGTEDGES